MARRLRGLATPLITVPFRAESPPNVMSRATQERIEAARTYGQSARQARKRLGAEREFDEPGRHNARITPVSRVTAILRAPFDGLFAADTWSTKEARTMTHGRFLSLPFLITAVACSDAVVSPDLPFGPALAKGGPTAALRADWTITDAGFNLTSDGKGDYRDGVCGASGVWGSDVTHLATDQARIPKSQQASCVGIAPRRATVTLAVRHLSDNPHVDDAAAPAGSGAFNVANVKFGWGAAMATTINASGSTPFCGSLGLRYTPVTFPGTNHVVREDMGNGRWHMYTLPWPDNLAYCENDGIAAYWHVSFDLYIQILDG